VAKAPRLYDTYRWKLVRAYVRLRDGGCVVCGVTEGLEVDHIVRPEDGGDPYSEENLRTLCGLHHRRRTARAAAARRRGIRPKPLRKATKRW
jgi:5-methylcytosine-specific restriction endonuclease McrA